MKAGSKCSLSLSENHILAIKKRFIQVMRLAVVTAATEPENEFYSQ